MANDGELCECLVELQNHNQPNDATTQSVADNVGNVALPILLVRLLWTVLIVIMPF